jgi:hypothetical protein
MADGYNPQRRLDHACRAWHRKVLKRMDEMLGRREQWSYHEGSLVN